jgi:hypothetical protein
MWDAKIRNDKLNSLSTSGLSASAPELPQSLHVAYRWFTEGLVLPIEVRSIVVFTDMTLVAPRSSPSIRRRASAPQPLLEFNVTDLKCW